MTSSEEKIPRRFFFYLFVLTFLAFSPSLRNAFLVWDDYSFILRNDALQQLTFQNIGRYFTEYFVGVYRPIMFLTYAIQHHFFGFNAAIFHLTNLLFHMANVYLTFLLARELFNNERIAMIAAFIFALHPIHVEAVAWISGGIVAIHCFFFLAAMLFYSRYVKTGKKSNYILALLTMFFGLFTKPIIVVLPLVLFLIDWLLKRKGGMKQIQDKIPFFLLSILLVAITIHTRTIHGSIRIIDHDFLIGFFLAARNIVFYISKTFLPINLSSFYPYDPNLHDTINLESISALLFIIASLAIIIFRRKQFDVFSFSVLFFFITILPASQIIPFGQAVAADRYAYTPLFGFAILAAVYLYELYQRVSPQSKKIISVLLCLTIFLYAYSTVLRCRVWKDNIQLWDDVLDKYPTSAVALNGRGVSHFYNGDYPRALLDLNEGIERLPNFLELYINRSNTYLRMKHFDQAISDLDHVLSIDPEHYMARFNRALVLTEMEQWSRAEKELNELISEYPNNDWVSFAKADLFSRKKNFKKALKVYNEVIEAKGKTPYLLNNRGLMYFQMKKYKEAVADFTESLNIKETVPAFFNRALVYEAMGESGKAVQDKKRANELGR